jgi:hypothetical protein
MFTLLIFPVLLQLNASLWMWIRVKKDLDPEHSSLVNYLLHFLLQGVIKCSALVHADHLYVGSHDRQLYKLRLNGEPVWQVP